MLVFGGREFAVHKLILASRSHVFADLFNSQQLDEEDPRLIIDDIDAETGEEFLRYLYTEKVTNLKQLARGLLIAADKVCIFYIYLIHRFYPNIFIFK